MLSGTQSALQTGLAGIQAGIQQFNQSAQKIAMAASQPEGTDLADLAEASVDLISAENQVAASAKIVKVSDEMLGTLLDVEA